MCVIDTSLSSPPRTHVVPPPPRAPTATTLTKVLSHGDSPVVRMLLPALTDAADQQNGSMPTYFLCVLFVNEKSDVNMFWQCFRDRADVNVTNRHPPCAASAMTTDVCFFALCDILIFCSVRNFLSLSVTSVASSNAIFRVQTEFGPLKSTTFALAELNLRVRILWRNNLLMFYRNVSFYSFSFVRRA